MRKLCFNIGGVPIDLVRRLDCNGNYTSPLLVSLRASAESESFASLFAVIFVVPIGLLSRLLPLHRSFLFSQIPNHIEHYTSSESVHLWPAK